MVNNNPGNPNPYDRITNATGSILTLTVAADNGIEEYRVDIYPPFFSSGWEEWEVRENGRAFSFYATFDRAFEMAKNLIVGSRTMVQF